MLIGGLTTVVWDIWLQQQVGKLRARLCRRKDNPQRIEESIPSVSIALENLHQPASSDTIQRRAVSSSSKDRILAEASGQPAKQGNTEEDSESGQTHQETSPAADTLTYAIPVKWGISIIVMFLGKTYSSPLPPIRRSALTPRSNIYSCTRCAWYPQISTTRA
jgi:hypothetical protein